MTICINCNSYKADNQKYRKYNSKLSLYLVNPTGYFFVSASQFNHKKASCVFTKHVYYVYSFVNWNNQWIFCLNYAVK